MLVITPKRLCLTSLLVYLSLRSLLRPLHLQLVVVPPSELAVTMTQVDTMDTAPQDEYEDMAGGPGAPLPITQLVVGRSVLVSKSGNS